MITEQRVGLFSPSKVNIPDVVNLSIDQPRDVQVQITGPKGDCQVVFTSPQGEFSFNSLLPHTRFEVSDSPYRGFQHRMKDDEHIVTIPPVRARYTKEPVLALLHEKGHVASYQDPEWKGKLVEANKELGSQLFSRAIDGLMWVSRESGKREKERAAIGVLLEEEMRATDYALQQVADLRAAGIDPVPHRRTVKELMEYLDMALETHNNVSFAVSTGRRKESLYDRAVNRLLGIPPRDNSSAIYIPNWDGVQRRWLFNWVIRSSRMIGIWTTGAVASVEIANLLSTGYPTTPEKFVAVGIVGVFIGALYTFQMVDPRQRY